MYQLSYNIDIPKYTLWCWIRVSSFLIAVSCLRGLFSTVWHCWHDYHCQYHTNNCYSQLPVIFIAFCRLSVFLNHHKRYRKYHAHYRGLSGGACASISRWCRHLRSQLIFNDRRHSSVIVLDAVYIIATDLVVSAIVQFFSSQLRQIGRWTLTTLRMRGWRLGVHPPAAFCTLPPVDDVEDTSMVSDYCLLLMHGTVAPILITTRSCIFLHHNYCAGVRRYQYNYLTSNEFVSDNCLHYHKEVTVNVRKTIRFRSTLTNCLDTLARRCFLSAT